MYYNHKMIDELTRQSRLINLILEPLPILIHTR